MQVFFQGIHCFYSFRRGLFEVESFFHFVVAVALRGGLCC
jgi:hypothetical protein